MEEGVVYLLPLELFPSILRKISLARLLAKLFRNIDVIYFEYFTYFQQFAAFTDAYIKGVTAFQWNISLWEEVVVLKGPKILLWLKIYDLSP